MKSQSKNKSDIPELTLFGLIRHLLFASLAKFNVAALPEGGRSSVEDTSVNGRLSKALGPWSTESPLISFEMLKTLKTLWVFNPDLSQFVANIIHLANTGHQVLVDATTDAKSEAVVNRLNESASRIYRNGAGVDGLINAYLAQVAWSGAISSEDVVNLAGQRVEEVVLVPVEQIRFRYEEGKYAPYQQLDGLTSVRTGGLIKLNPETYRYYALQTIENSPYAKPPATAAVNMITGAQTDAVDNISWIVKKFGILGLVSVGVTPPTRKPSEAEHEFQSRAATYLARVKASLDGNLNKGLLVTYKDQKVEHSPVTQSGQGAYEIFRVVEEQVMSGLAMQPAFFGRTDSTTETYADVVYNLLLAQIGNIQRLAKRRQEATYRMDLRLAGIEVDGVSLQFNRAQARDPQKEASAKQSNWQTVKEKVQEGLISPDEGAQELGYETWFDPELLSLSSEAADSMSAQRANAGRSLAAFRFDRHSQRYRFTPSRIVVARETSEADEIDNVVPLKKKEARAA